MRHKPKDVICDAACGTFGFLLAGEAPRGRSVCIADKNARIV